MKVIFIHTLNNYSGSPNVLSVVIKGLIKRGYQAELITGRGEGFLSGIDNLRYRRTIYNFNSKFKLLTLFLLLISQIQAFFMVLFSSRKDTIYYLNTITTFSAALACRLSGKKMVYHSHENMQQHKSLYGVYGTVYKWCNTKTIFVSQYVQSTAIGCRNSRVIYNGLSEQFLKQVVPSPLTSKTDILMVCSLRRFKGIYEFAELARRLPEYSFVLVVSDSQQAVDKFVNQVQASKNLNVFAQQNNLHPFYHKAKLLLSLSNPKQWIETFGLTIVEAMYYGIPAIVPNVGGPTEIVEDGKSGYITDVHDIDDITQKIKELFENKNLYEQMSTRALEKSSQFSCSQMVDKIESYITQ